MNSKPTHQRHYSTRKTFSIPSALALALSVSPASSALDVLDRTEVDISGKVVGALIADSNVSGMGVNNTPNGLYGRNDDPSVHIDTTLTRLNFGTNTQLEGDESIRSFISFDFNGANNGNMELRMREALVDWQIGNGSLLIGQTWSTLMDMNRLPDTVLEPTLSGVVFTRQPMIRWSQSFGNFRYDLALESGSNRVQIDDSHDLETRLDNTSRFPDFVIGVQNSTDDYWVRASAVVNHITTKVDQGQFAGESFSDNGWAYQVSGGIKFNPKDHFSIAYYNSYGNDRYVLGVNNTGPLFEPSTGEFHLRESQSLWTSLGHSWTDSLKSTFAYGVWQAEEIEWQSDTFTKTQFALANIKWTARENLVLGLEYNYTTYERSTSDDRDNHRVIFAVDYTF
ncbi:DcaP family trimeric outer membrane transporter [Vibrio maritimus]|uniref:DcaP family trimeric outer membrane transporter n=1 Tax=Vibrio maritimus TaxID=990268 RepID=UPI0037370FC0